MNYEIYTKSELNALLSDAMQRAERLRILTMAHPEHKPAYDAVQTQIQAIQAELTVRND